MTRFETENASKKMTLDEFINHFEDGYGSGDCGRCSRANHASCDSDIDCKKYQKEYWNEVVRDK